MATITLTAASTNWSAINTGSGPAGAVGPTDVILLNNGATTVTLVLNLLAGSTYTCAAVRANTQANGLGSGTHGHIYTAETAPGPVLDFEMQGGSTTQLIYLDNGKFIARCGKLDATPGIGGGGVVGGSSFNSSGIYNAGGTITMITATTGGSADDTHGVKVNSGTITTITTTVGGSSDGACGVSFSNFGSVNKITTAIGGSAWGTHGIDNDCTINTITTAIGGSAAFAYGVFNGEAGIITNPIETARGGTVTHAYAFYSLNTNTGEQPSITNFDLSGACAPVGVLLNLPSSAVVGSADAAGTGIQKHIATPIIVDASNVVVGNSNYTGGSAGTYPSTATSQAAQLATDQAAVTAQKASIKNTATILGVTGTLNIKADNPPVNTGKPPLGPFFPSSVDRGQNGNYS